MDPISKKIKKSLRDVPVQKVEDERAKPSFITEEPEIVDKLKEMAKILKSDRYDAGKLEVILDYDDNYVVRGIDRDFIASFIAFIGGDNTKLLGVTDSQIDYVLSKAYDGMYMALRSLALVLKDPYKGDDNANDRRYIEMYGKDSLTRSITNNVQGIIGNNAKAYEKPGQEKFRTFITSFNRMVAI